MQNSLLTYCGKLGTRWWIRKIGFRGFEGSAGVSYDAEMEMTWDSSHDM